MVLEQPPLNTREIVLEHKLSKKIFSRALSDKNWRLSLRYPLSVFNKNSTLLSKKTFGSLTAANWVSFDFNVAYSSCWGYSLINTLKLNKIWDWDPQTHFGAKSQSEGTIQLKISFRNFRKMFSRVFNRAGPNISVANNIWKSSACRLHAHTTILTNMWHDLRRCLWARRFRAALLLHTTWIRFWCNWCASSVAAKHTQKNSIAGVPSGRALPGHWDIENWVPDRIALRCVCCYVLLTRYWGILTVLGFPHVNRPENNLGWLDPQSHPPP